MIATRVRFQTCRGAVPALMGLTGPERRVCRIEDLGYHFKSEHSIPWDLPWLIATVGLSLPSSRMI